jgi:hypothetical protein
MLTRGKEIDAEEGRHEAADLYHMAQNEGQWVGFCEHGNNFRIL